MLLSEQRFARRTEGEECGKRLGPTCSIRDELIRYTITLPFSVRMTARARLAEQTCRPHAFTHMISWWVRPQAVESFCNAILSRGLDHTGWLQHKQATTCKHTPAQTQTLHTPTHTHIHTHTHTHTQTQKHTLICTNGHVCVHTHTHTQIHTNTDT